MSTGTDTVVSKQCHPIQPGASLDHYVIEAKLGRGGQADVYLARDRLLGRFTALKVFRSATHAKNPRRQVDEVLEEARMLAPLDHRNIVRVYHVGRSLDAAYMAMEYVPGGNLAEQLAREGPLSGERALAMLTPVIHGLQHAREAAILHRDLKPRNLLVGRDGELKLSDFGLGRVLQPGDASLEASQIVGTPRFLAPELWRGAAASERSDIYSLGACLYYMVAGYAPFADLGLEQLRNAHDHHPLRLPEGLTTSLQNLLRTLLSPSPEQRPSGWADLLDRLPVFHQGTVPSGARAERGTNDERCPWSQLPTCTQFAKQVTAAVQSGTGLIVATTEQYPPRLPITVLGQLLPESVGHAPVHFRLREDSDGLPKSMQLPVESDKHPMQVLDLGRTLSAKEANKLCSIADRAQATQTCVLLRCPEQDATHIAARLAAAGSPIRIQWLKWPRLDLMQLARAIVVSHATGPNARHWTPAAQLCAAQLLLTHPERWSNVWNVLHGSGAPRGRWLNSWTIDWAFDATRNQSPCPPTPPTWPTEQTLDHQNRLRRAADRSDTRR